jgi:glycosyltransferase involved in cell wall biosynthesis
LKGCELFETVIPSKIFEIMAMGRPIIMGVKGQARQFVLEAGAGLEMEPDSAESLMEALENLLKDAEKAPLRAPFVRSYVAAMSSRDSLAARYLALLVLCASAPTKSPNLEPAQSYKSKRKAA